MKCVRLFLQVDVLSLFLSVVMALPKIPFGDGNAAKDAETKLDALGCAFSVRTNQVFSVFCVVLNDEVSGLRNGSQSNHNAGDQEKKPSARRLSTPRTLHPSTSM
jgi:hypothetical protein